MSSAIKNYYHKDAECKAVQMDSFRLQQVGLEYVGHFLLCFSPHQKRYLKNHSECSTSGKKKGGGGGL